MSFKALFVCIAAMVVQAAIAFREGNFTLAQMIARGTTGDKPMPFLYHGEMWGDLLLVSPVVAIAWTYHRQWRPGTVFEVLIGCSLVTSLMHIAWAAGTTVSEHIVEPPAHITQAGLIHAMYMAFTLSVIVLFYWCSGPIATKLAFTVSFLLSIHMLVGTIQPGMYKSGNTDLPAVITTLVCWALIWYSYSRATAKP